MPKKFAEFATKEVKKAPSCMLYVSHQSIKHSTGKIDPNTDSIDFNWHHIDAAVFLSSKIKMQLSDMCKILVF